MYDSSTVTRGGIYEGVDRVWRYIHHPHTEGMPPVRSFLSPVSDRYLPGVVNEECGIRWDDHDIDRFLSKCVWRKNSDSPVEWCLEYTGAKSRGKGNIQWYGSFWTKGKTVRAHKFFAVAVLGLRPSPRGIDELDHLCFNTRCVCCIECVPREINQGRIRNRRRLNKEGRENG